jgi:hypothetical protein
MLNLTNPSYGWTSMCRCDVDGGPAISGSVRKQVSVRDTYAGTAGVS